MHARPEIHSAGPRGGLPMTAAPEVSRPAPALEIRGAIKSYGLVQPKPALRGVSLRVERGECYGLAGQNGAGKTTLIRLLLGLAQPDAGELRLLGGRPDDPELRRRVGFVPESAELPPAASPRALVRRWARLRGLPARGALEQGVATLQRLGMSALLDRPSGRLSKGERQRTLLALALLGEPELLILDEPTDGLDPLGRALMRQLIREECAAGRTVFLNSHLLAETERICTRVGILHQGLLVREERLQAARAGEPVTTAMLVDALPSTELLHAAHARAAPARPALLRELTTAPAGALLLVDHQTPAALNAAIDTLRAAGTLILELRPVRADLEAALAEVVGPEDGTKRPPTLELELAPEPEPEPPALGEIQLSNQLSNALPIPTAPPTPPPALEPLAPLDPAVLPAPALRPLRALGAIARVAAEIAADLAARKIGWIALLFALLCAGGFLAGVRSQLVQGLAAAGRIFGGTGGILDERTVANLIGSNAARTFYWTSLFGGISLSALFAPPLLDPRRTVLLLAQPISRADFALGLYAAVCLLATSVAAFFSGLLVLGLRWLGLEVPARFLLVPLPWLCAFAAIYAAVLLCTFFVRNGLFAAVAGLALLILATIAGNSDFHRPGAAGALASLLYGLCPKLVELGAQAGRLGEGGVLSVFPFVSTLLTTAALLLFLVVAARRSER